MPSASSAKFGQQYEPDVENPMIGFPGCGRYTQRSFEVQGEMDLKNVKIVIPFVRTLDTAGMSTRCWIRMAPSAERMG